MRGWSSLGVGIVLLLLGALLLLAGGYNGLVLLFATAGVFLIVRGMQGVGVADAGDPTALADFLTDPADALLESALDKGCDIAGERKRRRKEEAAEPPAFDADAAFARYMANNQPQAAPAAAPQPVRGFGRKRV